MLTTDQRALLIEIQDHLLDLFVQHDEASRARDFDKVGALQTEIDDSLGRQKVLRDGFEKPGRLRREHLFG